MTSKKDENYTAQFGDGCARRSAIPKIAKLINAEKAEKRRGPHPTTIEAAKR